MALFPNLPRGPRDQPLARNNSRRGAAGQLGVIALTAVCIAALNVGGIERLALSSDGVERKAAETARQGFAGVGSSAAAKLPRALAETLRNEVAGDNFVVGTEGNVLFAGDSMMGETADAIGDLVAPDGYRKLIRRGTTLGVPELFDWEQQIAEAVMDGQIGTVMLLVDASPRNEDRSRLQDSADSRYADQWFDQTQGVTNAALQAGAAQVVLLERPYTSDSAYEAGHAARNAALQRLDDMDERVSFLRAAQVLSGSTGQRSAYAVVDGRKVRVGDPDGYHLTAAGAEIYASEVFRLIGG